MANEYDALTSLWAARPSGHRRTAPAARPGTASPGGMALLSTAVPGTPLTIRYYTPGHVRHPGPVAEDFALAGAWLARFQEETLQRNGEARAGTFEEWIRPTLHRYRAEVGWSSWESDLVDHLSEPVRRAERHPRARGGGAR